MRCKVWKHSLLLLCAALLCILLSACGENKKHSLQFFSMDTLMQLTAYGDAEDALQKARTRIEELDEKLNAADPSSAVSVLKSGDRLEKDLLVPFQTAQTIRTVSGGALDLTLYPLSDAWGFYSKQYRVPSAEEISALLRSRGTWSLEEDKLSCTDGTVFDLGSVAKGYAAQCAADILHKEGISSAVLALGGNVQTIGQKPDGSDWVVAVADPLHPDDTVGELHVGETAVVTSGSYQRNFTENGKTYHHILDPKTGYPADSGLLSVTVLHPDGTTADALSTALFINGVDKAKQLLYNSYLEISFDAVFITENLSIYVTPGIADRFEKTNEQYATPQILR